MESGATLTPMHDLPPEIVCVIFTFSLQGDASGYPNRRTQLALISKRFYTIVHDTPSFWTRINAKYSRRQNSDSLIRSKNLPFDIDFTSNRPFSVGQTRSWGDACHHLQRWRSVTLSLDPIYYGGLQSLLEIPMTMLEEISLETASLVGRERVINLFNGQAERLQTVQLKHTSIPWKTGMLRGLRTLALEYIRYLPPTLEDIAQMLASSPQLSLLKLHGVEVSSDVEPAEPRPIHLPLLHSLDLCEFSPRAATYLLQHIQAPPCKSLSIRYDFNTPGDWLLLLTLLRPFIPTTVPNEDRVKLKVDLGFVYYSFGGRSARGLKIWLAGIPAHVVVDPLVSILPQDLLQSRTQLDLRDIYERESVETILTAVDQVRVTKVTLRSMALGTDIFLRRLAEPTEDAGGCRSWPFPSLQDLHLHVGTVPAGTLARTFQTRYGAWHDGTLGGGSTEIRPNTDRPLPLTSLTVSSALDIHAPELPVIQAIVGTEALKWEWSEGAPKLSRTRSILAGSCVMA